MKLNWGVIATGRIAGTFARALERTDTGRLLAVASRTQASADEFAAEHHSPRAYGSYQALLEDPEVNAVYISTPHPMHHEWAIKAAQAKKHVFCEKPVAMNEREAAEMIAAAKANSVAFMETFMYRAHPQARRVVELIRSGAIGTVKMIYATYGFNVPFDRDGRIYNKGLGGGAILDVGCYVASSTRLFAGAAMGQPFADPIDVKAVGFVGEAGVDEWTTASVRFPGEVIAQWTTGLRLNLENGVRLVGTDGWIHLKAPHHPGYWGQPSQIVIQRPGQCPAQEITIASDKPLFTIGIETFTKAVSEGRQESPAMTWADTLGNMRAIDRWRKEIGLVYDADRDP